MSAGHLDVVEFLLNRGADLDAVHVSRGDAGREYRSTAVVGAFNHHEPVRALALFRLLLSHGARPQALLKSALSGSPLQVVKLLLESGADPNIPDENDESVGPPLYYAAGNARLVRLLLRHGARVDARNRYGSEAIHFACCWGKTPVVKVLLEHGADPNSVEDTDGSLDIPLYYTCGSGYLATTRTLLAAGADPNFSPTPRTALMRAARHGCSQTVEALLEAGGDPTRRDDEGRTALDYALDWQPDLLTAALAEVRKYQAGPIRWRWRPRKTQERKLEISGGEWTDGHTRIVELLKAHL